MNNCVYIYKIKLLILCIGLTLISIMIKAEEINMNKKSTVGSKKIVNHEREKEIRIIKGYLYTDSKYNANPIPTKLDRSIVLEVVKSELSTFKPSINSYRKFKHLSPLTIFYNLKELAGDYFNILKKNIGIKTNEDKAYRDPSYDCIITLAWITKHRDKKQIYQYFKDFLKKYSFFETTWKLVPDLCNALDSKKAIITVKKALKKEIKDLNKKIKESKKKSDIKSCKRLEEKLRYANGFIRDNLKTIEGFIKERDSVRSENNIGKKIRILISMYLTSYEQYYWTAIMLIRESDKLPSIKNDIVLEFRKQLNNYAVDEERYKELESKYDENDEAQYDDIELARLHSNILKRTVCFHAIAYFEGKLNSEETNWLKKQEDNGTILLALRIDWKYQGFFYMQEEERK